MATVEEYVSRIEETCGEEKHFIVFLKYEKKKEAINKILAKTKMEKSISSIIFELNFKGLPIRVYSSGKILFKNIKDKTALTNILSELLI